MPQNKANQWIHTLLPVLLTTLRGLGDAPARSVEELAKLLDQSVTSDLPNFTPGASDKAPDVLSQTSDEIEQEKHEDASPPLFAMMAQKDASSVLKTKMNRKTIIAG